MARTYWYFKLFNSIKEVHEVEFAELELSSLFGPVQRVRNFSDILKTEPFNSFTLEHRIQDYLSHELPYGEYHGFTASIEGWPNVARLVRRLAYIAEFYVATETRNAEKLLKEIFSDALNQVNVQTFVHDNLVAFRFITNQYFLEKSQYVSKLSRNEDEVDQNIEALMSFPVGSIYRIPASATMQVGKRLEDYFAIREEPSLHLTHYLHPYKGKFHPKMVRALLNYVYPDGKGLVMDNFSGSGTLLVEAVLMGLDSLGLEINPLSALMSQVKCESLDFEPKELRQVIERYLDALGTLITEYKTLLNGDTLLVHTSVNPTEIKEIKQQLPKKVHASFNDGMSIDAAVVARNLVQTSPEKYRNFLLLAVSGTISDVARRTKKDFVTALEERLNDLYLRIYIFHKLNQKLKINLGHSRCYVGDTRDMGRTCFTLEGKPVSVEGETIDAIVNSPPYSTALDYIRNDLPQLTILGLVPSLERLEKDMMGNPNLTYYPAEMSEEIKSNATEFSTLPEYSRNIIGQILNAGRIKEAIRTYKFFKDMRLTLGEMHRVLKPNAKAVIIIGNNHYKLNGATEEVKNDLVIVEMAKEVGFSLDRSITRNLEKSMSGEIRYESIIILQKTR
ncbi:MAG: hypothetical protein ABSC50_07125 [Candidatus Bathyarchaeia archaeon]